MALENTRFRGVFFLCVSLRSSAPLRYTGCARTFTAEAQRNAEIRREEIQLRHNPRFRSFVIFVLLRGKKPDEHLCREVQLSPTHPAFRVIKSRSLDETAENRHHRR